MSMFNAPGALIGVVETAIAKPDVLEVKHKMLGGAWVLQQIGNPHTILDVTAHVTMSQKTMFDTVKKTGGEIEVIFDNRFYRGYIDEEVEYERLRDVIAPIFKVEFAVLVREEGDV